MVINCLFHLYFADLIWLFDILVFSCFSLLVCIMLYAFSFLLGNSKCSFCLCHFSLLLLAMIGMSCCLWFVLLLLSWVLVVPLLCGGYVIEVVVFALLVLTLGISCRFGVGVFCSVVCLVVLVSRAFLQFICFIVVFYLSIIYS